MYTKRCSVFDIATWTQRRFTVLYHRTLHTLNTLTHSENPSEVDFHEHPQKLCHLHQEIVVQTGADGTPAAKNTDKNATNYATPQ